METNLQKIRKLLAESELSKDEQDEFVILLALVQDEDLNSITQLFSQDRSWIRKIYQNVKEKRTALSSKDVRLWEKILQEEESQLKELER